MSDKLAQEVLLDDLRTACRQDADVELDDPVRVDLLLAALRGIRIDVQHRALYIVARSALRALLAREA